MFAGVFSICTPLQKNMLIFVITPNLYYLCSSILDFVKRIFMGKSKNNINKKGTIRTVLLNILAMALVVVVVPYLVLMWLDSYTHHGESYAVPDVCGMQLEDAKQLLRDNHLDLEIVDYKYKKGAAENEVVEQNPVANSKVKEGRKIMLTMSSTALPMAIIPSVIDNCSLREAEARLKSSGFVVLGTEVIRGEKEWVYAVKYDGRKLSNGESVPKGAGLVIVMGSGNEPEPDEIIVDEIYFD